ncbi:MAG: acyl-CoA dehydrogenase family protein, partial [Planctomycetota bacterium]
RDYAASREQFGVPIEKLPAVRDMVIDMKMAIEAGRALLYETGWIVDHEIGLSKIIENSEDKGAAKAAKKELKFIKRLAGIEVYQAPCRNADADEQVFLLRDE